MFACFSVAFFVLIQLWGQVSASDSHWAVQLATDGSQVLFALLPKKQREGGLWGRLFEFQGPKS